MNIKKIGLTALAASLVSVSANAGELTVSGAASIGIGGYSSEDHNRGATFSMGNQITFSGGGELDNGMNVSLSFTIDQGDDTLPFDGHSITISSEGMGTLKFSGEGGSSASTAIDGTAAGDIWDAFDGAVNSQVTGVAVSDTGTGDNSAFYTLPSVMDGVELTASYKPQGTGAASELGYGISYTGIEGLTAQYAMTDKDTGTTGTSGDQTVWKLSYAYGPVTAAASNSDYDVGTSTSDQEVSSYKISYTVSDELSVSYGTETIEKGGSNTDAEYTAVSASYTAGGMTLSASVEEAENVDHSTNSNADVDYWFLGAAFAF
ncbi:porin [Candidatus Pelagibacter sp. HIMB1495]|uniref:porin n=1 Tax=unclassified Candidatus Pelagibacter TaxID=2647897 RepID=UPI003F877B45